MDKIKLKQLVDNFLSTFDLLATKTSLPDDTGEVARFEIGKFMMYLSASDGIIKWNEARFISDICNLNLSPNELGNFIRKHNIYSTEFEQEVPVTFKIVTEADKKLKPFGFDGSYSAFFIDIYREVGKALIFSDGDADNNEVADYKIYINMLEEYRDTYLNDGIGASGFSKNSSSVSAPSKSGVSAPRKG